jgi:hypothetical protein
VGANSGLSTQPKKRRKTEDRRRNYIKSEIKEKNLETFELFSLERNSLDNCGIVSLNGTGKADGRNAEEHTVILVVCRQTEHRL